MITNVNDLVEFMEAESIAWARDENDTKTDSGTGAGIKRQWENRDTFPCPIYYLAGKEIASDPTKSDGERRIILEVNIAWFDEDGNVTDKPNGT